MGGGVTSRAVEGEVDQRGHAGVVVVVPHLVADHEAVLVLPADVAVAAGPGHDIGPEATPGTGAQHPVDAAAPKGRRHQGGDQTRDDVGAHGAHGPEFAVNMVVSPYARGVTKPGISGVRPGPSAVKGAFTAYCRIRLGRLPCPSL
jgi:hypothetical protein